MYIFDPNPGWRLMFARPISGNPTQNMMQQVLVPSLIQLDNRSVLGAANTMRCFAWIYAHWYWSLVQILLTMPKQSGLQEPSSWMLNELHLVLGFLSFSELTGGWAAPDEEETGSSMSYVPPQLVRPLTVVPELVEPDAVSEPAKGCRNPRARDPPEGKESELPCHSVASEYEDWRGDDMDSVRAVSPPSNKLRGTQWEKDDFSCATGRIVFIEKP